MDHQNGKTILYVGGFELPDKNAAAHRVLNNAKIFRELGYRVVFCGIHHGANSVCKTEFAGFECWSIPYPVGLRSWLSYLTDFSHLKRLLEDVKPDGVVFYNFQSVVYAKALAYCKKHCIWTIADVTEWYVAEGNVLFRMIKQADTSLRMRRLNCKTDGVIAISTYLFRFYKRANRRVIQIPPLVDLTEEKWCAAPARLADDKIHLVYAGSTTGQKDDLKSVLHALAGLGDTFVLHILGLEETALRETVFAGDTKSMKDDPVICHGRIEHTACLTLIKQCDFQIFVRPNNLVTQAGFPTKLGESFACGTPVITNISSNIDDYLVDRETGFVLETNSCEAIKDVLTTIAEMTQTERVQLKSNCKSVTSFDYRTYVDEMKPFLEAVYGECDAKHRRK